VGHDDGVPLDPTLRPQSATTVRAPQAVLTVSGVDRPGVTARLFAALADPADGAPAVEVLDVEQVVVHGHLVLGVVTG
jgi:phosphoserine phosphatase